MVKWQLKQLTQKDITCTSLLESGGKPLKLENELNILLIDLHKRGDVMFLGCLDIKLTMDLVLAYLCGIKTKNTWKICWPVCMFLSAGQAVPYTHISTMNMKEL